MNHWRGAIALTVSGGLVLGPAVQVRANPWRPKWWWPVWPASGVW